LRTVKSQPMLSNYTYDPEPDEVTPVVDMVDKATILAYTKSTLQPAWHANVLCRMLPTSDVTLEADITPTRFSTSCSTSLTPFSTPHAVMQVKVAEDYLLANRCSLEKFPYDREYACPILR